MVNLRPEEVNIIKYIRNFFRLKKELNYTAIKNINMFRLEKKIRPLRIESLEILRIFLSMKKKEIITNQ